MANEIGGEKNSNRKIENWKRNNNAIFCALRWYNLAVYNALQLFIFAFTMHMPFFIRLCATKSTNNFLQFFIMFIHSFVRSVFFCSSSSDAEHFNGIVFHPIYNLFWVNIFFSFILFYFFRSRWVKIKTNHLVNSFNCTIFMAYHISFKVFANWAIFVFFNCIFMIPGIFSFMNVNTFAWILKHHHINLSL